jgi:ribonuclease I
MRNSWFRWLPLALTFVLLGCQTQALRLRPVQHADFGHYTLALTWQPGFCATGGGCLASQPKSPLIGLHGLWASRPQALLDAHVSAPQWWRQGCDYFRHSDAAPVLGAATRQALDRVMPHVRDDLLVHEYDKHVQCFQFDTETFFRTELAMRRAVVRSPFGAFLLQRTGQPVTRAQVVASFMRSFGTRQTAALQLRCAKDAHGQNILTQLWITIPTDRLDAFPATASLMNAPIAQDNCPPQFTLPAWPAGS